MGRRRLLGLPREGGAIGVWVSGMAYGLVYALLRGYDMMLLSTALLGSIATLFLVDWARYGSGFRRLVAIVAPGVLLGFVVFDKFPWSLALAAFEASLLVASLQLKSLWRIVLGGGLLGGVGGFVALASPECGIVESLLPGSYLLMATGFSGLRAVGVKRETVTGFAIGLGMLTAFTVYYLLEGVFTIVLVLSLDVVSRVLGWLLGFYQSMRLRTYGFLEAFRTLVVMVLAGFLAG